VLVESSKASLSDWKLVVAAMVVAAVIVTALWMTGSPQVAVWVTLPLLAVLGVISIRRS
jgi:hypothetical protein